MITGRGYFKTDSSVIKGNEQPIISLALWITELLEKSAPGKGLILKRIVICTCLDTLKDPD